MSEKPNRQTTESQVPPGEYKKVEVVSGDQPIDTASTSQNLRTVTTSLTQGDLKIRYTPRDPNPLSGKTTP